MRARRSAEVEPDPVGLDLELRRVERQPVEELAVVAGALEHVEPGRGLGRIDERRPGDDEPRRVSPEPGETNGDEQDDERERDQRGRGEGIESSYPQPTGRLRASR